MTSSINNKLYLPPARMSNEKTNASEGPAVGLLKRGTMTSPRREIGDLTAVLCLFPLVVIGITALTLAINRISYYYKIG